MAALDRAARDADYYAANRERIRARQNADAATSAGRAAQRRRNAEWRARDPLVKKAHKHDNNVVNIYGCPPADHDTLLQMAMLYADPCSLCGEPTMVIDHIVPISHGGEHDWFNMTGMCRACNSMRGSGMLLHMMLWRLRCRTI